MVVKYSNSKSLHVLVYDRVKIWLFCNALEPVTLQVYEAICAKVNLDIVKVDSITDLISRVMSFLELRAELTAALSGGGWKLDKRFDKFLVQR